MGNISLNIPEILKYGIIGLGALLGILAYFLITKEQNSSNERPKLITSIYVFMFFSIVLIVIGAVTETQKKIFDSKKARFASDSSINILSRTGNIDNFFLGTWKGKGKDLINYGYKDTLNDGYNYDFNFTFSIDSLNRIHLSGTYTGTPKTSSTPQLKPRKISGFCIKDGEFLRLLYDTHPQENDHSRGFGVMIFQFLPSNEDAKGFYCSRSAKTGAMVSGQFVLYKP